MYEYKARVLRVVDGDTVDVEVDLGFRIKIVQRCRLRGLNAPEMKGATREAGLAAMRFVDEWLGLSVSVDGARWYDKPVVIRSRKPYGDDKYGRFLVDVYRTEGASAESLNAALLRTGNAVPFMVNE